MIKSRTAQLVFQSFFVAFGLVGIVASLGLFDKSFSKYFYVYFTNLSNYFCEIMMIAQLVCTIKKKDDSFVCFAPALNFAGVMSILLTFLVYNLILSPSFPNLNFQLVSILFHVVLPVMYVANWLLFYERKTVRWFFPLVAAVLPITYFAFVFIRAAHLEFNAHAPHIYPYFFLNLEKLQLVGVMKWSVSLLVCFVAAGYLLWLADKICGRKHSDRQSV